MKCENCGSELLNGALFCDNCGKKVEAKPKKFCGNCGAEMDADAAFCGECGMSVNGAQTSVQKTAPKKKKNKSTAVIVILAAICIALGAVIAGYLIYSGSAEDKQEDVVIETVKPKSSTPAPKTPAPTPSIAPTPEPSTAVLAVTDMYNPSLTYKRMPEISTTSLTDGKTLETLKNVIVSFNSQCESYMNGQTGNVPSYIKPGTTAYAQQTEYKQKHPNLKQTYQKTDVLSARSGGAYYYVWVTEVLNVTENGSSKTVTDHWVYKIENDNGALYVCDYTADPAYK